MNAKTLPCRAISTALFAGSILIPSIHAAPRLGVVAALGGEARGAVDGRPFTSLYARQRVGTGDVLKTGAGAFLKVTLDHGGDLALFENTQVRIDPRSGGDMTMVSLEWGGIALKEPRNGTFVIAVKSKRGDASDMFSVSGDAWAHYHPGKNQLGVYPTKGSIRAIVGSGQRIDASRGAGINVDSDSARKVQVPPATLRSIEAQMRAARSGSQVIAAGGATNPGSGGVATAPPSSIGSNKEQRRDGNYVGDAAMRAASLSGWVGRGVSTGPGCNEACRKEPRCAFWAWKPSPPNQPRVKPECALFSSTPALEPHQGAMAGTMPPAAHTPPGAAPLRPLLSRRESNRGRWIPPASLRNLAGRWGPQAPKDSQLVDCRAGPRNNPCPPEACKSFCEGNPYCLAWNRAGFSPPQPNLPYQDETCSLVFSYDNVGGGQQSQPDNPRRWNYSGLVR